MKNFGLIGEKQEVICVITMRINNSGRVQVKTLMLISCEMRLKSEVKRYCITGEDKQCG